MESVLVLAGSLEQARHYADRLGLDPKRWLYVTPKQTRGRENPVVYRVGTYYMRDDIQEVQAALAPTFPTYIDV